MISFDSTWETFRPAMISEIVPWVWARLPVYTKTMPLYRIFKNLQGISWRLDQSRHAVPQATPSGGRAIPEIAQGPARKARRPGLS